MVGLRRLPLCGALWTVRCCAWVPSAGVILDCVLRLVSVLTVGSGASFPVRSAAGNQKVMELPGSDADVIFSPVLKKLVPLVKGLVAKL